MKLKYYLRGLGIGIVVTAIIMTVALGNKQPMTDDEVIARAKQLGMIENSVLTELAEKNETKNETKEEPAVEKIDETKEEPTVESTDETTNEMVDESIKQEEDVKDNDVTNAEKNVSVTVVGGDSSWSVAKRMEEAGLVESAKDFDTYLCKQGYDKRISVGTYEIPVNATHEEMAKIITKSN